MKINYDFSSFSFNSLQSWVNLFTTFPRSIEFLVLDTVLCCHYVRRNLHFSKPFISFFLILLISTSFNNYCCLINREKLSFLNQPYDLLIIFGIWALFNYFPFDLIFKLFWIFTPILDIIRGMIIGRDISDGIIFIKNHYSSPIHVIIGATIFGSLKYILIEFVNRITRQHGRSFGPIVFHSFIGSNIFYWFTSMGHISSKLEKSQSEMSFIIICIEGVLSLLHLILRDSFYTALWNASGKFVGYFIPYYGQTWIPVEPTESDEGSIDTLKNDKKLKKE